MGEIRARPPLIEPLLAGAVLIVGVIAGATAALAGFGIGSLLTPLLTAHLGAGAAIAAVSIPHAIATALRAWRLRAAVDWAVVRSFGIVSAIGGIAGGLLYTRLGNRTLTVILGALLLATGALGLAGVPERWRPRRLGAPLLGLLSGFFGGIAGNQGGLRSAALTTFRLDPKAFVATSTVTALLVDAGRTPFYILSSGPALRSAAGYIAVATVGVTAGTLLGERILLGMPPARFRRIVSLLIAALGIWLIASSLWS